MLDMSLAEMAVIVVVAVVAIGPKELPTVIRAVGRGIGQLKGLTRDLRAAFDELASESGVKEVKQDLEREMRVIQGDDGKDYESYDIADLMQDKRKGLPHE